MVSEAWFDFATRGAAQLLVDDSVSTEAELEYKQLQHSPITPTIEYMTRIIGKCAKLGGIVCVHVHSGGAGVRPEAAAESEERK